VPNGWECCRYLRISDKVVNVIFIAVPIRAETLLLLHALAEKNVAAKFVGIGSLPKDASSIWALSN
jgi:hypothetical protein